MGGRMMRVRAALAGLLLVCAGCGGSHGGAEAPRYLLWQVDGPASRVYLLGSVHVLRKGEDVRTPAIERAYAASSSLVMELDFDDFDVAALGDVMARKATDAGGLVESLGEEGYGRAAERAARLGLDLEPLRPTEPWFAALSITDMALDRLGFGAEHGVEAHFTERARVDGKPIAGLETAEFQIGLLDAMPADQQRELFFKSIEEAEQLPGLLEEMLDAWRRGDEQTLRTELETNFEPFPDLYRSLIADRNERWVPAIDALLAQPGDHLVIVGALHLIGEHSVIRLLEQRGYRISRL
jgi:uncharacterized protein YbaP (TraB family)